MGSTHQGWSCCSQCWMPYIPIYQKQRGINSSQFSGWSLWPGTWIIVGCFNHKRDCEFFCWHRHLFWIWFCFPLFNASAKTSIHAERMPYLQWYHFIKHYFCWRNILWPKNWGRQSAYVHRIHWSYYVFHYPNDWTVKKVQFSFEYTVTMPAWWQ